MGNRKVGILLIILGFIILGFIIYFLFFVNFSESINILRGKTGQQETSSLTSATEEEVVQPKVKQQITIIRDEAAPVAGEGETKSTELKKTAMSFAERFGSYSNHSDFSNITDLKIFMTEKMSAWADTFIVKGRNELGDTSIYQGVITKAITAEVKAFDLGGGVAQILVKTQQTASNGADDKTATTYEDILITFIKGDNGEWLVNEARWE